MIDPQRLAGELVRAGWTVAGRGRGYVRLLWPGLREHEFLLVPTDTTAPDFDGLWQAAISELEDTVATGVRAAHVLAGLVVPSPGKVDQ